MKFTANKLTPADGGRRVLFAFAAHWPAAAEFFRSACDVAWVPALFMTVSRLMAILGFTAICLAYMACSATEKILLPAKINGKGVRLCFDSGSDDFFLSRDAAQRLGLRFAEASSAEALPEGQVGAGVTERCTLLLGGTTGAVRFRVIEIPTYIGADCDGGIGWRRLGKNVVEIDATSEQVKLLDKLPKNVASWTRFGLAKDLGTLALEVPVDGRTNTVCVDTGSEDGVSLPPEQWRAWKAQHPGQAMTANAFFTPGEGLVVGEEAWASQISIGGLVLTEVPVMEATRTDIAVGGSRYAGTLGLAALRRINLIVDGKSSEAYLRISTARPKPYSHNRLGAAFIPMGMGDGLVGHVMAGSPAQAAGLRDGDQLLEVDGVKVSKDQTEGLRHFSRAAGTKVSLTLRRDGKTFSTVAVLRDILRPSGLREK